MPAYVETLKRWRSDRPRRYVPSTSGVSVRPTLGLGTGASAPSFSLKPDANELSFGSAMAIDGDILVVASSTALHIYDL